MNEDVSLVKLLTAKSPAEAEVVKGLLEAEGIPVNLRGEFAADDLAISLQASGFLAVDVEVPSDRLEEARRLVEEAHRAGEELERQAAEEDKGAEEAGPTEEDVGLEPEAENQF